MEYVNQQFPIKWGPQQVGAREKLSTHTDPLRFQLSGAPKSGSLVKFMTTACPLAEWKPDRHTSYHQQPDRLSRRSD